MDKNTLIGVVLMALIILGFSMLNKPSEEELKQQQEAAAAVTEQATQSEVADVQETLQANEASNDSLRAAKYGAFAPYVANDTVADAAPVKLENSRLALEISPRGAMISKATLKDYNSYDSTKIELISPDIDSYSFTFTTARNRFDTNEFVFKTIEANDTSVTLGMNLADDAFFGIRYNLPKDSYLVEMELIQRNMDKIIPSNVATIDMRWNQKMHRNEAGRVFEERNSALYYMYMDGNVDNLSESSDAAEELNERLKWIGFKDQFFSMVLMAKTNFSAATLNSKMLENNPDYLKDMTVDATLEYSSKSPSPASFVIFMGPNSYPLLDDLQSSIFKDEDMHLTKLIPLGWSLFRWINTLIVIPVFNFLGSFISSYGIIILLLTIFIKIILFPFTYKSYMSQAKMRVLAPEIKEINDKYPGNENAMKRQQETMALYSRAGASPFSGCLPMLLQMPILIAMFSFFPSAIELRGQSFLWAHDLSAPDAIISWDFNIPFISSTFGNHISLFCLLMTVVNIIYTKINMQLQPSSQSMPAMKWMMYLMPVMFLFFFNNYAAGLSYYYFLSLLITIIQTWVFRKVVNEEKVRAQMAANAKKPRKKSGFMARLEEAQRKQEAMLREQQKQKQRRR